MAVLRADRDSAVEVGQHVLRDNERSVVTSFDVAGIRQAPREPISSTYPAIIGI